ncbi:hypothetical protein BD626DRAFT_572395 [Schizophyllum amplum]|nr:hypothetical protein BD626DRAFT_572395 [Auriculariopsis ampla]
MSEDRVARTTIDSVNLPEQAQRPQSNTGAHKGVQGTSSSSSERFAEYAHPGRRRTARKTPPPQDHHPTFPGPVFITPDGAEE